MGGVTKTISATKAARELSDLLDRVEHAGEEFVIERHGRVIATLGPAVRPRLGRVTLGELKAALAAGPRPDPGFAADLEEIRRRQPRLPPSPWESS